MQKYGMTVRFRRTDGREEAVEIDPKVFGDLVTNAADSLTPTAARSTSIEEAVEHHLNLCGEDRPEIEDIKIFLFEDDRAPEWGRAKWATKKTGTADAPDPAARRISHCRSLLQLANLVLPSSAREGALDEWMDELQSAAEEDLPIRRRALSILCRSLPVLALRARLPVRAQRGEG